MIVSYLSIFVFAFLFTGLAGVMLAASSLLGPQRRSSKVMGDAYECGMEALQPDARERYTVPFYLVAILFILFDVETVFLLPWAVGFDTLKNQMGPRMLILESLVFIGILALGLVYVIKRRGLEWD